MYDQLTANMVKNWAADATDETGNFDPKKMLKPWNKLPADSRAELFSSANQGLHDMLSDLGKTPEANPKVIAGLKIALRAGAGAALGGYLGRKAGYENFGAVGGALLGMAWHGGERDVANKLAEYIADHPAILTFWGES